MEKINAAATLTCCDITHPTEVYHPIILGSTWEGSAVMCPSATHSSNGVVGNGKLMAYNKLTSW